MHSADSAASPVLQVAFADSRRLDVAVGSALRPVFNSATVAGGNDALIADVEVGAMTGHHVP